MVTYTTTTLNKQGALIHGDVTYNVNVTAINSELTRLNCSISKTDNSQVTHIGSITLEHGRQVIEIVQGENIVLYLTKFQEILDEVLGKTPEETDPANNTAKK